MSRLLVFGMILITTMAAATAYNANRIVERVQATGHDADIAAAAIPAIRHFQMMFDQAIAMAVTSDARVKQLERYINDNGLPLPTERVMPPAKERNMDEVI